MWFPVTVHFLYLLPTGTLSAQNDNMDTTAAAAFSQPDEVPFIVALVVSCVLVVGIIILLFIMGW